jgi:integrase/recombinase XerD
LCGVQWKHVHAVEDGAVVTIHGKGGKTRHVRITRGVALDLERVRAHSEAPVFATRSGRPMHPSSVAKLVRRVARRAGVSRTVCPHSFRHSHASHALDKGAPIHVLQATLGHASVATTGRYLHARPTDGTARFLSV